MQSCRACGQNNHDHELFCNRCGQFIEHDASYGTAPAASTAGSENDPFEQVRPQDTSTMATAGQSGGRRGPAHRAELELLHLGDFVCSICRAGNPPERTFCRGCGSRLRVDVGAEGAGRPVLAPRRGFVPLGSLALAMVALIAVVGLSAGAVQLWSKREPKSLCPETATISRVHAAAGAAFAVRDTRSDTGRIVLQFSTTWPRTSSGALIVSICLASGDEYWYFARDSQDAPTGAFVPALVLPDGGFRATSPRDDVFIVNGSGLSINGKGLGEVRPLCLTLDKVGSSWASTSFTVAPPCNDRSVRPWRI